METMHSKSHFGSYEILKHYNQSRIVSTQMKLTQKVDHFTVFESFPSTSCCSHKFPPNKIEKIGWLDVWGNIRDVYIGWEGRWTGRKKLQLKIVVGHAL